MFWAAGQIWCLPGAPPNHLSGRGAPTARAAGALGGRWLASGRSGPRRFPWAETVFDTQSLLWLDTQTSPVRGNSASHNHTRPSSPIRLRRSGTPAAACSLTSCSRTLSRTFRKPQPHAAKLAHSLAPLRWTVDLLDSCGPARTAISLAAGGPELFFKLRINCARNLSS